MARRSTMAIPTGLSLYLLGPFRIESKTGPVVLPARKAASLLAYLVLHPEGQAREKAAALFWGDVSDVRARASLRNALAVLRKFLGDELLIADRETVQINPGYALWVDAREFEAQANSFLAQFPPDPSMVNIDLYRGDLLMDFYDDWIVPQREHYRALYVETVLRLARHLKSRSEYDRAIELAKRVLASDAGHEPAHQILMFCYSATGNRSAALEQYERCRRVLQDEFSVEPLPETTALYQWIQQQSTAGRKPRDALLTNLPIQLTSFVGREREMAEVKQLLREATTHLLTLTGSGGCGKTRLAVQVATDVVDSFKDGVWWVELATLMEPTLVPQVVAKALGVREEPNRPLIETLANSLRPKRLFLVLDNCEHLITASAQLSEALLRACPHLQILTTSREMLGIIGETAWRVPSLSLPDPQPIWSAAEGGPPVNAGVVLALMQYEAVRLFVERAVAIQSDFALTEQNAWAVAQVCHRLDGMPLAIELAAARVKVLSVEQIAARLDDRFNLLTSGGRTALPRHQTLRAAIDWSYDLLVEAEQVLFPRLSVFAGGFTLQAAEAICSDEPPSPSTQNAEHPSPKTRIETPQVLDLLSRLVNKSLVIVEHRGEAARYRLLETIRQYGQDRLWLSGEEAVVRRRHLDWCVWLAEQAEDELLGANQGTWLDRLETEHDNLRAALQWSLESGEAEAGLRLAATVWRFWVIHSHLSEGRRWLEQALAVMQGGSPPMYLRAKALRGQAGLAHLQGDQSWARLIYEEALALFRGLADKHGIAITLSNLGYVALMQADYSAARAFFEEGLGLQRALGDRFYVAYCLQGLGLMACRQRDYAAARSCAEQALATFQELENKQYTFQALGLLGIVALAEGDHATARSLLTESLAIGRQVRDKVGIAEMLDGFACLAVVEEEPERAVRLFGAAEALREAIGNPSIHGFTSYDEYVALVRAVLKEEAFAAAWAEGRAMGLEQAIEYALGPQ